LSAHLDPRGVLQRQGVVRELEDFAEQQRRLAADVVRARLLLDERDERLV
jgi:hypothetical protein